ncbi:MAG: DUF433 domain-containing protein [Candidatus Hydrogenedentes bacterium]|nr:DUF433 domain-containing protein [Candidatus Hydrogenedentota bacterium]
MNALEKIRELLPRMSEAEKAHLLRVVVGETGNRVPGIETIPDVCGGSPCVVRTRIPVWLLEKWRRLGKSDAELLGMYPSLRSDDLHNAWAYVATHAADIDRQIRGQEDD